MFVPAFYPESSRERDQWILARRTERRLADPFRPQGFLVEPERSESGQIVQVATVFLTNRECPWRCLMCDLWKDTLTETVPKGAIPAQIDHALAELGVSSALSRVRPEIPPAESLPHSASPAPPLPAVSQGGAVHYQQLKLYNAGSFFDPRAIPPEEYETVAARIGGFERVIVECHPHFVGPNCLRFRDLLARSAARSTTGASGAPRLEVAIGLETVQAAVLAKLNKRMTLEQFSRAAEFLRNNGLALRVFVLIQPPFLSEEEGLHWAQRSIDFAFDAGATVVSLIPTRPGNGALDALQAQGQFTPPKLSSLESAHVYGVGLHRGRVFADLWDLLRFARCAECFPRRLERLRAMNLSQTVTPAVSCSACAREQPSPIQ